MRLPSVEQAEFGVGPTVRAGGDAVGECPQGLVAGCRLAAFAGHVASAGVHVDGRGVAVEALFDEPVWGGRLALFAAAPLLFSLLFCRDPASGAVEVLLLDAFEEAEQVETGRAIVHVFDSRG